MRKNLCIPRFSPCKGLPLRVLFSLAILSFVPLSVLAQFGPLACNSPTPMVTGLSGTNMQVNVPFPNLTVNLPQAAISPSNTDFATISIGGFLGIEDQNNTYPAGTFAGIEMSSNVLLALSGTYTLEARNNGSVVQTVNSGSSLLSLLSFGTKGVVGFTVNAPFDEIRINYFGVGSIDVYGAIFESYCSGPALSCNTKTLLSKPSFPLYIEPERTSVGGLICVGCSLDSIDQVLDNDPNTAAEINLTVGVGNSASISVVNALDSFPAGTFAGYELSGAALLNADVLTAMKVITYNNGAAVDSTVGANLIRTQTTLLNGLGRNSVGFRSNHVFDEVRLVVNSVATVGISALKVYGVVVESFCAGPQVACNQPTAITNPIHPVYVNGQRTSVNSLTCVGCGIENGDNVIDANPSNFARMALNVGVLAEGEFSVANAIDSYAVGTYAGFDIETAAFVNAAVLNTVAINLYNNGTLVQSGSAGSGLLVGVSSSLLSNTRNRQLLGVVAEQTFDEVQIVFTQPVGATLGDIYIYNLFVQNGCSATLLCNTTYAWVQSEFPVIVNPVRTGVFGVVGAGASVQDPGAVVTASPTDFAKIENTATVAAVSSISVLNVVDTMPSGSRAGFVIRTVPAYTLNAALLNSLTITTRLNGVVQESKTAANLLSLNLLSGMFGGTGNFYYIGFNTTQPYNEITLEVAPLVNADLVLLSGSIDVFGAFVDTKNMSTFSSLLNCATMNPDFSVGLVNEMVVGNVSTNDAVPPNTTYSNPQAAAVNPSSAMPALNPNGTYSMVAAVPGVYRYFVTVCPDQSPANCAQEDLQITILDAAPTATNPPIANTDIAATDSGNAVNIIVLENDGIGTPGSELVPGTVTLLDKNGAATGNSTAGGTATVNASGVINYTPPVGFMGRDTLAYNVCDDQSPAQCDSAFVVVWVGSSDPSDNNIAAADDYTALVRGTTETGNVLINDTDPEGNIMTVTAFSQTVAGDYTFTIDALGNYSVTIDPLYIGTGFQIVYNVCDNGTPQACANATINVLVPPTNFPLPIGISDFAVNMKNCEAFINWQVANGKQVSKFEIFSRSKNTDWTKVGDVSARSGNDFTWVHSPEIGINWYRLAMHNVNGEITLTHALALNNNCSSNGSIQLFPNPAQNEVQIIMPHSQSFQVELLDATGRVMMKKQVNQNAATLDVSAYQAGIYTLRVIQGTQASVHAITIIR